MKKSTIFLNGLIKENPTFVMLIGMCPTIAITTNITNALGMGVSVIFVLFFSNLFISLIRKIVPNEIRIPVFIVIIATLVTIVQMLLKAYLPGVEKALGVFVDLIVVNCLILGRAEAFASKNDPVSSMVDAIGMGLGFMVAICIVSIFRQLLGMVVPMFQTTIGGFLILGLIIGIVQSIRLSIKPKKHLKEDAIS